MEPEKSTFLTSDYTTKLQSSREYGPVFPAAFIEEAVFAPLYILASFVKNKVPIGAWVYFWHFYLVPLVYTSVFVPVPYVLMTIAL